MSDTATRVRVNSSFSALFQICFVRALPLPCSPSQATIVASAFSSWTGPCFAFDTIAGHDKFRWKRERKIPVKRESSERRCTKRKCSENKCSQTRKHSAKLRSCPTIVPNKTNRVGWMHRMHRVGELRENSQELSQIIGFCQAPDCVRCGCAVDRRNTSCA